jgi:hypothetical protein
MNLFEFFEAPKEGYQNVEDDNSQPQLHDLRKTKLTLKQINKLRQLNDVRMFEYNETVEAVKKQYAPPAQPTL